MIKLTKEKDGLSLIVTLDILLCTLDDYSFSHKTKMLVNNLKKDIEPYVDKAIDACYEHDQELIQELGIKKTRLFNQLGTLREYEMAEVSDVVDAYLKHTEENGKDGKPAISITKV